MSGGESRFLDAEGLRLHAELLGVGRPVLLLHGFTGSTRSLEGVATGLADAYRTLRIDLPGHGRSEAPRDPAAYAMDRCARQVMAAAAALGTRRPHLLGYSMGGRLALFLCAAFPGRFASALLVGASAGLADPQARAERVRDDEALATRIERDGVPAFVDAWMAQPLFASQRRLPEEAQARFRAERLDNRTHGLAGSLRGMGSGAQPPLHARLPGVALPVRLVVGELDAKFHAIADELASLLPHARVTLVKGAGHAAHLEQPERFLRVAKGFFAAVDAGALPHPPPPRAAPPARSTPS